MRSLNILVFAFFVAVKAEETCRSVEDQPYVNFGTKTTYGYVNTGVPKIDHGIPRCTPHALWLLARHGARVPVDNEINDLRTLEAFKKNVIDNYRPGNRSASQRMCPSDLNMLEGWHWDPQHGEKSAGDVTSEGYFTTQKIAQAWRHRYPDLFTSNTHDYTFELPNGRLWQDTYRAFTEGLFGQMADSINLPKRVNDTLFKAYQSCPVWIRDVKENNSTLTQYEIFKSTKGYRDMIAMVSQRLGFNYDIDSSFVDRMYDMCRYNTAWDPRPLSPWCAAFSKEDLQRLEYAEDLKTYYTQGYGSPLNQKVACPLITDMMKFFTDRVQDPNFPMQPRAMVRFTDDPTYLMALSALGAHRDAEPLPGDGYGTPRVTNRKWTTSTISPFNANIAAVLYRCKIPNSEVQFKVLFLENEYPMALDECSVGLCDWSVMRRRYGDIAANCDMKFCNAAAAANGYVGLSIALAAFVMGIIGL